MLILALSIWASAWPKLLLEHNQKYKTTKNYLKKTFNSVSPTTRNNNNWGLPVHTAESALVQFWIVAKREGIWSVLNSFLEVWRHYDLYVSQHSLSTLFYFQADPCFTFSRPSKLRLKLFCRFFGRFFWRVRYFECQTSEKKSRGVFHTSVPFSRDKHTELSW